MEKKPRTGREKNLSIQDCSTSTTKMAMRTSLFITCIIIVSYSAIVHESTTCDKHERSILRLVKTHRVKPLKELTYRFNKFRVIGLGKNIVNGSLQNISAYTWRGMDAQCIRPGRGTRVSLILWGCICWNGPGQLQY